MKPVSASQPPKDELSRRSLVRKAAYSAPVVFVVAAAPYSALGASGPKRKDDKPRGHKPRNHPRPRKNETRQHTTTNRTVKQETKIVSVIEHQEKVRVTGAVSNHGAPGAPVVTKLPSTGSGNDESERESSNGLIAAASLSVLSTAAAIKLCKTTTPE